MEELFNRYQRISQKIQTDFVRSFMQEVNWNARLIGIKGARGVGKTTLLLQYLKINFTDNKALTLYVSLDSFAFRGKTLLGLADEFVRNGGKHLFLDEVHKYPNWAQELKNIYDDYSELQIVFTGSSLLEILNSRADLSRRVVIYHMQGLSFREFIMLETGIYFAQLTLESILKDHLHLAGLINAKIKVFPHFEKYLKQGYYPFYREELDLYEHRVEEVINMMIEIELPLLRGMDIGLVPKIKQLLVIISESVPFVPNIVNLSQKIEIHRTTLMSYLFYLQELGLTYHLLKEARGSVRLQKPAKIYLENTNLMYVLSSFSANRGNVRETFFANQVGYKHKISFHEKTDFLVDNTYAFEIGGKDKSKKQITGIENAYIVSDEIEYGYQNKIPIWLFGFLY
ncbi:MAG: AAA family ATPase [Saprospiraceae bacterium]|nr:AAA family ATPase [Saprospiraceae bacterium]